MSETGADEPRTLIAIPAYNEAASVGSVIHEVRRWVGSASEILVVDDGSSDATVSVSSEAGASVLSLPFNVGVGGAMRVAFLYAQRFGYSQVVQVDADGQHDPKFISQVLSGLDDSDIVIGSRFAGVGSYEATRTRRWAMRLLSTTLSRILGTRLTDATSGFRAVGPRAIELFSRELPAEYLGDTVESLVIAHRSGLTIRQVGVHMRPRQSGSPSQSSLKATVFVARALLVLALSLARTSGRKSGLSENIHGKG